MTSKKFTLVMFASTVIFKSFSRKIWQKPFLILSICSGFQLKAATPSSLYRPMLLPYFLVRQDNK